MGLGRGRQAPWRLCGVHARDVTAPSDAPSTSRRTKTDTSSGLLVTKQRERREPTVGNRRRPPYDGSSRNRRTVHVRPGARVTLFPVSARSRGRSRGCRLNVPRLSPECDDECDDQHPEDCHQRTAREATSLWSAAARHSGRMARRPGIRNPTGCDRGLARSRLRLNRRL